MSVYVIAQLKFTNKDKYNEYMAKFPGVFKNTGGRVLAGDESPSVLEGEWGYDKVVVLEFDDADHAKTALQNPEFKEISQIRRQGADSTVLLVNGL